MVIFLSVYKKETQKTVGTLEIVHQVFPGGEAQRAYEWIGTGASDGGTWEWVANTNFVEMLLTSNIRKGKAAVLSSTKWKKDIIPPHEPWFPADWEEFNTLTYFGLNGEQPVFGWTPKK